MGGRHKQKYVQRNNVILTLKCVCLVLETVWISGPRVQPLQTSAEQLFPARTRVVSDFAQSFLLRGQSSGTEASRVSMCKYHSHLTLYHDPVTCVSCNTVFFKDLCRLSLFVSQDSCVGRVEFLKNLVDKRQLRRTAQQWRGLPCLR